MKKTLFFLLALGLFFPRAKGQDYAETIRQYVLEKLVFYYVDNPGASKPSNLSTIEVDKITVSNGGNLTTPLWTNPNNVGLKDLMKKLLCSTANGGDAPLQQRIANVLLISDKKVYVFLYNDFGNAAANSSWDIFCTSNGYVAAHNNASWPCASRFTDRRLEASGHIAIGSYFFNPTRPGNSGGWALPEEKLHVFIHEMVHTQIPWVQESTLGSIQPYGLGGHSVYELLPSKNTAFNEGIATSFAMCYYMPPSMDVTTWMNSNINIFADNISGCGASTTPSPHCIQTRLANASVATQTPCGANAACYPTRAIPDDIIMHCETVDANILYQYMKQFGSEMMLVRDIKSSIMDMYSEKFTFTALYRKMLASSNNFRNPSVAASGPTPKGASLTLAILDYYSGYKIDNLNELGRITDTNFETLNFQYVRDYFSMTGRQKLLTYRTGPADWDVPRQLDRFATDLNVRSAAPPASPPPSPAPTAPTSGGGNE